MEKLLRTPISQQIWVCTGVFLGSMSQGCSVGYPATLIPQLRLEQDLILTEESESWIASIICFGLLLGAITGPIVMGKFGRKPANILSVATMAIGWLIFLISDNISLFILARFITGVGMGQSSVVSGVTIAEYTSPKMRGPFSIVSLSSGFATGVLLVHSIGSQLLRKHTAAVCLITPVLSLLIFIQASESPHWLASKGKYDQTRKVFKWLRGNDDEVNVELETMINARIREAQSKPYKTINTQITDFLKLFISRKLMKPLVIVVHLFLLSQFAASNIISTYALDIFAKVGESASAQADGSFWMIAIDAIKLIGILFSTILIRYLNRRTVLYFSGLTSIFTMLGLAMCSYLRSSSDLSLVSMIFFVANSFFAITGIIPLPFSIAGEIFPMEVRSVGNSSAVLFINLTFFLMLKSTPALLASLGVHGFFCLYAGGTAYCLVFLWFTLPETKDKTLEHIEGDFKNDKFEAVPTEDLECYAKGNEGSKT